MIKSGTVTRNFAIKPAQNYDSYVVAVVSLHSDLDCKRAASRSHRRPSYNNN